MSLQPLSVVVITFNEEANIARCLQSVEWAEERIVVDCGSSDRTVPTASDYGARVLRRDWSGYADQKNHGIAAAAHDWVLSLDADEWLDDEAAIGIRAALRSPVADGYRIRRLTAFCGEYMTRIWRGDRPLRLFRRTAGRFTGEPVHESFRLQPGSKTGRIAGTILHLGYPSIRAYVERMNRYTDLAARGLDERGLPFRPFRLVLGPVVTFVRLYFLQLGLLDGVRGWIVAAGSAYYVALREAKLWERRQR